MKTVNRKHDSTIAKSSHCKIKPTFRVTFIFGTLSITCSPQTVVIIGVTNHTMDVARIKLTVEVNERFPWLVELKSGVLR
jgi:hypothetical protein